MKKTLCILLCLMMVLGVLASCGEEEATTTTAQQDNKKETVTTDDETTENEAVLDVPEKDYSGSSDLQEFVILERTSFVTNFNDLYGADLTSTSADVDRAVYNRRVAIEDEYGVTFTLKSDTDSGVISLINNAYASQEGNYDLYGVHGRYMMQSALQGALGDWNNLTYVALEKPWWNQSSVEAFTTAGGHTVMVSGDVTYTLVAEAVGMFFNRDILDDARLEYPYEIVEKGEWTLEKFIEYAKACDDTLVGDDTGEIATDCFGYITGHWRGPIAILYSTGSTVFTKTDDGELELSVYNEKTENAFSTYFDFLFGGDNAYAKKTDGYTDLNAAFKESRSAFFDQPLFNVKDFASIGVLNYGILPWPKADETVDDYYCFINCDTNYLGFLNISDTDRLERNSIILEVMAYEGYKEITPVYYEKLLKLRSFKDERDSEMLTIIHDNVFFDFGYAFLTTGQVEDIGYVMCNNGYQKSFKTTYEELESESLERLQEWYDLDDKYN